MTEDELRRLIELRPNISNVHGFCHLLYELDDLTPERRMVYEAHFATSAYRLAVELNSIINAVIDRAEE